MDTAVPSFFLLLDNGCGNVIKHILEVYTVLSAMAFPVFSFFFSFGSSLQMGIYLLNAISCLLAFWAISSGNRVSFRCFTKVYRTRIIWAMLGPSALLLPFRFRPGSLRQIWVYAS